MTNQVDNVQAYMQAVGERARAASRVIAAANTGQKNQALIAIADAIMADEAAITAENQKDLIAGKANGLDAALLDRLELNHDRISGMAEGLRQIAALPDPVGEMDDFKYQPSGLQIGKMRVPLGVIGIIYESRPNVTADAAALCMKSGNACILRGGSEAKHSNLAVAACIKTGLKAAGLDDNIVQVVETTDRAAVGALITMPEYVDVIVPRGGKGLIERISGEARVPVIKHLDGNCHVYIDAGANHDMAIAIAFNAKTHRYGVCNAMETLLVHQDIAAEILPELRKKYVEEGVELRGCDRARQHAEMTPAQDSDWDEEYLAPILAVKVVDDVADAIDHITKHSSQHTETIVTDNHGIAMRFLREVDSSSVMINASTRFADGFEYGLGAEIGISTDKIHVRGPVGLEGLTTQKYVVFGDGQIRQ